MTEGRRPRTRGAGSVFRDAKGVWHYRHELPADPATGRRRRVEATGRTRALARERLEAKLLDLQRTGIVRGGRSPYLEDYVDRWLEDYRTRVKPTTYRTRAGRLRAVCEVIGHVRLTDLTADHVRRCMRVLGDRLAPATLKDHYVSLKMVLDQAELEELIPVDPCRRVRPPRVEPTETRVLGPSQPRALIDAAAHDAPHTGPHLTEDDVETWALLFELAFVTGMRAGERYALMPFELELRDGVPGIHVTQQIQRYGRPGEVEIPRWLKATHLRNGLWLTTPKTPAADRFIPVPRDLWDRLWARIRRLRLKPRDLVFVTSRGHPVTSSLEWHHWNRALEAAGLPRVRIHSARHWLASMTARAGMPDDARIAIMGHVTPAMTMRYTHRDAADLGRLMASVFSRMDDTAA